MRIEWLGHACFKLVSALTIITDPYDNSVGYPLPQDTCDIVTISHSHFDHNYTKSLKGSFKIINSEGKFEIKDVKVNGIKTYHDKVKGAQRGENIIFLIEMENLRICHLGDLGHILSEDCIKKVGKVDILLIPVGGTYTINAKEAKEVVFQLKPAIVIPMHYKTSALKFPLASVSEFLKYFDKVNKINNYYVEISSNTLPEETEVYVLEYRK